MADERPAFPEGGGEDLAAKAKSIAEGAKRKARTVRSAAGETDVAATDIAAARRALTKAQVKALDALAGGEVPWVPGATIRALRDKGLVDFEASNLGVNPLQLRADDLTNFGRQVAATARQAEQTASAVERDAGRATRARQRVARAVAEPAAVTPRPAGYGIGSRFTASRARDERPSLGGADAADLERRARALAVERDDALRIKREYDKSVAAGKAPATDSPEFLARQEAERARLEAERRTGGGGRRPPPAPPAPPAGPPDDPRGPLFQRLAAALEQRVRQEQLATQQAAEAEREFRQRIGAVTRGTSNQLYQPGSSAGRAEFERQRQAAARAAAVVPPAEPVIPPWATPRAPSNELYQPGSVSGRRMFQAYQAREKRRAEEPGAGLGGDAAGEERAALARLEAELAQRADASAMAFQREAVALRQSSQDMRRHGALSTEFVSAAARGEATFREFGWQITSTAAKFAGWTAVSIPIFGLLQGFRQLGQGAIASASGVGLVHRVINNLNKDQLQGSFRSLAGQFNVPISAATEAVYRSGQVFQDQAQAIDAAKAALYSYTTGEVDVATSTRYLNAIAQGFNLTGHDQLAVYDQINQAQNRFGITIQNTEAGMARASGTFRNAGGSLSYLLALLVTGQRATGRSGENIGTLLQRSIGFIQRPKNQDALRSFGIDPGKGIESTINQAFRLAQHLQGQQLQQLATALSSPQYASYWVPILKSYDLFRRVSRETSAEASKGSAARELGKHVSQLDQQIAAVGIHLQQIGSGLAQSGLVDPLAAGLKVLNQVLSAANFLLNTFNQLPVPLRHALSIFLEMRLAAAALRRLNVGTALENTAPGVAPFLVETAPRRTRRLVGQGLDAYVKVATDEQEAALGQSVRARTRLNQGRGAYQTELQRIEAAGLDEEAQVSARKAAALRLAALETKAEQASNAAAVSIEETVTATEARTRYLQRLRSVSRSERDAAAAAYAAEEGIYVPTVLGRPSPAPVGRVNAQGRIVVVPSGSQQQQAEVTAGDQLKEFYSEHSTSRDFERVASAISNASGVALGESVSEEHFAEQRHAAAPPPATGAAEHAQMEESRRVRTELRKQVDIFKKARDSERALGNSFATVDAVSGRFRAAAGATGQAAVATAGRMRELATGVIGMVGPFEAILAGLILLPIALEKLASVHERSEAALKQAEAPIPSARAKILDARRQTEASYKHDTDRSLGARGREGFQALYAALPFTPGGPGRLLHGTFYDSDKRAATEREKLDQFAERRSQQLEDQYAHRPVRNLSDEALRRRIDADAQAANSGAISLSDLRSRSQDRISEVYSAMLSHKPGAAGIQKRLVEEIKTNVALAAANTKGFVAGLLDLQNVGQDQLQGLSALIGAGVATPRQRRGYLAEQLDIAIKNRGQATPDSQAAYATAVGNFRQALESVGQDDLNRALAVATTEDQKNAAYRAYYKTQDAESAAISGIVRNKRASDAKGAHRRYLHDQARLLQLGPLLPTPNGGAGDPGLFAAGIGASLTGLATALPGIFDPNNEAAASARYQAPPGVQFARTEGQIGGLSPQDVEQHNAVIQRWRTKAAADEKAWKAAERMRKGINKVMKDFMDGIQKALGGGADAGAGDALAEQAAVIEANTHLAVARAGDNQGLALQRRLSGAQQLVAFAKAHQGTGPGEYKPSQITDLEANVVELQTQAADQATQDARDLINAHLAYRESGVDNAVTSAKLEAAAAAQIVARGGFKNPADKLNAEADARKKRLEVGRTQRGRLLDNLDYRHDIQKITDEAWLKGMERILGTMKKGTDEWRALKQRIGRAKHDLDQSSELDLNVGNIRLPTAYEIRREIAGNPAPTTQQTVVHAPINVTGVQDPEAVGNHVAYRLHQAIARGGASSRRARGG